MSYSKRLSQRDAQERAKKKAAGAGFLPKSSWGLRMTESRKPCPSCNGGSNPWPKALRTERRRASGGDGMNGTEGNGCGNCGGDGYLDPGDRGYRR